MTYSEEMMVDEGLEDSLYYEETPNYPVIFGVSITPPLIGALAALVGVGIASYGVFGMVMPQQAANQELRNKLNQIDQQIKDRENNAQKIAEAEKKVAKAKEYKEAVASIFANEQKLDTLLIDLNKLVDSSQGELRKYTPDAKGSGVVTDGSLGESANNKVRRKSIDVEVSGEFDRLQSIVRTIERLDQLLIIQDFQADSVKLAPNTVNSQNEQPVIANPKLSARFKVQAIIPLTPEEIAANTPSPSPSASASPSPSPSNSPGKK